MNFNHLDDVACELEREFNRSGKTYKELGELSGLSWKTVSRVLNGKQEPAFDVLMKIAKGLGFELGMTLRKDDSTWGDS